MKHKHRISNANISPPLGWTKEQWNNEMEETRRYFNNLAKKKLLKWYERLWLWLKGVRFD